MEKTKEDLTTIESLGNHIARAVIVAPELHPKTNQKHGDVVVFTRRPYWSKIAPGAIALPGGKIEFGENTTAGDFTDILPAEVQNDPFYSITLEQMIQAGLHAAVRESAEELGLLLLAKQLRFVDKSTNTAGWTTYCYLVQLLEKPILTVESDSAGTLWMDTDTILNKRPKLLSGHLAVTRRALRIRRKIIQPDLTFTNVAGPGVEPGL